MKYYSIKPDHQLTSIVRSFWVFEGESSIRSPFISQCFATECPGFVFHYKGHFTQMDSKTGIEKSVFNAGLYGQTDLINEFITRESFGIFGVYLYPHALSRIFKLPAQNFTHQLVDLEELLGKEGRMLKEQINLAKNVHQRIEIIKDFITKIVYKNEVYIPCIFESIENAIMSAGTINITQIAEQCSLSRRQFERKFKEYTGFSPKQFCRITRFNTALKSLRHNISLTQLAYDLGYYDQSHFTNDFKAFSGIKPSEYFIKYAL